MKTQTAKRILWHVMLAMSLTLSAGAQQLRTRTSLNSAFEVKTGDSSVELGVAKSEIAMSKQNELPDAPSASREKEPQEPAPPPPPALAVRQSPGSTLGLPFLAASGALLGSTIANVEMISNCRPTACEAVPSSIRNRGDLYAIGIPASLAVSYISYRLKRGGTKLWILPIAVFTAGNVVYAAHAAQFSH